MSKENPRSITQYSGGVFQSLVNRVRLIVRLMADSRVNPLLKLIPIGSLVYFIFPDLAPGPVDDAAILWLCTYLFVELCPPDVVQEHLRNIIGQDAIEHGQDKPLEEDVIEGEVIEGEGSDSSAQS
jgi:hypothetical protein